MCCPDLKSANLTLLSTAGATSHPILENSSEEGHYVCPMTALLDTDPSWKSLLS
jgi:hypothetical protein